MISHQYVWTVLQIGEVLCIVLRLAFHFDRRGKAAVGALARNATVKTAHFEKTGFDDADCAALQRAGAPSLGAPTFGLPALGRIDVGFAAEGHL